MPKEVIHDRMFGDDDMRGLRTELRWNREAEYIQLATVADELPQSSGMGAEGWFVSLSRHDCNLLIKHLRRARDQVYGRDE